MAAAAVVSGRTKSGVTLVRHHGMNGWCCYRDAHPGYITWEDYEENLRRLRENAQAHGVERRKSPPREGPALLQGQVICGICGARMTVHHRDRGKGLEPEYRCQRKGTEDALAICQRIPGETIDRTISQLVVESVNPLALGFYLCRRSCRLGLRRPTASGERTWNGRGTGRNKRSVGTCAWTQTTGS